MRLVVVTLVTVVFTADSMETTASANKTAPLANFGPFRYRAMAARYSARNRIAT